MMDKELKPESRDMETEKSKKMNDLQEQKIVEKEQKRAEKEQKKAEIEQRILNRYFKARYNPSKKIPFLTLHDARVNAAMKKLGNSNLGKFDNGIPQDLLVAHKKEQYLQTHSD